MAAIDLVNYYQGLLILQYIGKPKASATVGALVKPLVMPQVTVQTVTLSAAPTAGTFTITWNGATSAAINWNDSTATIQTKVRAITGLSATTVLGTLAGLVLTLTFTGQTVYPAPLVTATSSLTGASGAVTMTIAAVDDTLPIAVREAFNLVPGTATAVGVQLDILGKYVGVTRNGLDDADFLQLIRLAIIRNSADSSLASIQTFLQTYFPNEIRVFDYQNMRLSYLVSTSIGSQSLVRQFVSENLLPKPAGVQLATTVFAPDITKFFGFRTYHAPLHQASGYNTYTTYSMAKPWLSYKDGIS